MLLKLKHKPTKRIKPCTGTREWADSNINICFGCKNNCRYCYAKKMAIRFGRKTEDTWKIMEINSSMMSKNFLKRKGTIMFPSTHDIVPEILDECLIVLEKLLIAGNDVLITSKPNFFCIKSICDTFQLFKSQILFRFTIGSSNDKLLQFWEPEAPLFVERLKSLKYAFSHGFSTSISIEPFLQEKPELLVTLIEKYVTDTIWIGKMNYIAIKGVNDKEKPFYNEIRRISSNKNIERIYLCLNNNPKIRWKDSIKKILDLPLKFI